MKTIIRILLSGVFIFIWLTARGQLTWYEQDSPVSVDLISLSFTDTNRGWAIGHYGEVIRTVNGGKDWALVSTIDNFKATKIFFIDELNGWATGFSSNKLYGRVLHTNDAGDTWTGGMDSLSIFFNDVFFYDVNRGWIVGYDTIADTTNYIMHTSDGGITWNRQMNDMLLAGAMLSVHFRDSLNGNIVGTGGFFLHTYSGGEEPLEWWLDTYNWQISMTDVYNVGDDYGCMIGSGGIAYFTTDNWASKKLDYELPVTDTLRAISGTNNLKFWAVGNNGTIVYLVYSPVMHLLIIADQSYATGNTLNDVKAVTDSNVWAVGNNGKILHYGIEEESPIINRNEEQLSNLQIYPNPVSTYLNLADDVNFNCSAIILNSSGTQFYNTEISIPGKLDLSKLPVGIYMLKLFNENFTNYRLIIKH